MSTVASPTVPLHRLAIFASGSGSNAQKIIEYFGQHPSIRTSLVLSNNRGAGVLTRAADADVPTLVFDRPSFYQTNQVLHVLQQHQISFVALAGFLWLMPSNLVQAYPNQIVNIHPALLPKFGGKGMYGSRVHEAVVQAGESESGITIHYVNEHYDEGQIIFQASCLLSPQDTPADVAARVQTLEHRHFPRVIEQVVLGMPVAG